MIIQNRKCPICESKRHNCIKSIKMIVPENFLLQSEYDVVCCDSCGFVFHNVTDFDSYDNYYKSYTGTDIENYTITKEQEKLNLKTLKFIDELPEINKDDSILDVGCSYGITLTYLKEMGYSNLHGMDLDIKAIQYLEEQGINSKIGSIMSTMKEYNGKFNLIILRHIIEHLEDPKKAIQNVKKWLKPEGKIIIESPNLQLYNKSDSFPGSFIEYEHINHFSLISLMNLMNDFNLKSYETSSEIYPTLRTAFEISECAERKICKEVNDEDSMKSSLEIPNELGRTLLSKIEELGNEEIAIWGVSTYVYRLLTHTSLSNCNIKYLVDINLSIQSQKIMGMNILDPKVLKDFYGTIVICGQTSLESIKNSIKLLGFKNKIVCLND